MYATAVEIDACAEGSNSTPQYPQPPHVDSKTVPKWCGGRAGDNPECGGNPAVQAVLTCSRETRQQPVRRVPWRRAEAD